MNAKPDGPPPMDMLKNWIDESYRAVAKKSRIKQLIVLGLQPPS